MDPIVDIENVGSLPHRSLLALVWACFSTAFLFVGLRTVIRLKFARGRLTAEDYWMFAALATLLTFSILETLQLNSLYYMTGVIAGVVPVSEGLIVHTEQYLRFEFPIVILFWTVLWCVKAGFLALYFKLFRELAFYRRVWYVLAASTFLSYVGCITTLCLSCRPISNFFVFAQCGAPDDVWRSNFSVYFSTVLDVFTDLLIMAMPIRLIYNVKISRKQKAGLVCVFGLCFVMIAFAIIRAKQVLVEQYFVNLTLLMVWSTLAAAVSVVVGSLPALKLLITNRSSKRSQYGYGSSAGSRAKPVISSPRLQHVPLRSLSSETKVAAGRRPETGDSTEDILKSDGSQYVVVKHDIEQTVSYRETDRPYLYPVYQNRRPGDEYGRAI